MAETFPEPVQTPDDVVRWLGWCLNNLEQVSENHTYFSFTAEVILDLQKRVAALEAEVAELNGYLADSQLDGHERDRNARKVRILETALLHVVGMKDQLPPGLDGEVCNVPLKALKACDEIGEGGP